MAIVNYVVGLIDAEHQVAANVALALYFGDDPSQSTPFQVPANATGSPNDPVTHWYFGVRRSDAQWAAMMALRTALPPASWPVTGVDSAVVTEAEALAATAAMDLTMRSAEENPSLNNETLLAALGALGLQRVVDPE